MPSGLQLIAEAAGQCSSLEAAGCAMAWLVFNLKHLEGAGLSSPALSTTVRGKSKRLTAMHRGGKRFARPLFPLPCPEASHLHDEARIYPMDVFCTDGVRGCGALKVWTALSVCAANGVAGFSRAPFEAKPTALQDRAIGSLQRTANKILASSVTLNRTTREAEKELATRFMNYTGEEVPKMQVISVKQILPALPPETHSGTIDALELLSESTKRFLLNPGESLKVDDAKDKNLKAKVHVKAGDELALCRLLVERRICVWVPREEILTVDRKLVLNGMFAVGKGSYLDSGEETQRLIMNLVPVNSVLRQAQGSVADLPGITQYLSLVLEGSDQVSFYQSDMSAAFYLFRIPPCWNRYMAFNISFSGEELGFGGDTMYHLGCGVIPMGWGSSVSIMQEIAQRLATIGRLPSSHQVRRTSPLPLWLVDSSVAALQQGRAWFHVYLDNFCAMEKKSEGATVSGGSLHERLEGAWSSQSILSSAKKRVAGEPKVLELGASLDGTQKLVGGSGERILKLIQSTLVVISKERMRLKWVQVVVGRWVHLFSFRRAAMVVLDEVWKCQRVGEVGRLQMDKVRSELFQCCMMGLMIQADVGASISAITTASDASSTGGAVGVSRLLSSQGSDYVAADRLEGNGARLVPVMVISLFNGIVCTFRCYDLIGVSPLVGFSFELSPEGNRICARRWPWVVQYNDVRELTVELLHEWRYKFPQVEEIHLWGGFPCVDLSSVRYNRQNLSGASSGLFWEMVRILRDIRAVFGYTFRVLYFAENVASMDREAEREISATLGTKPFRVDPADSTPIHRPRFCWTNVEIHPLPDVEIQEKPFWKEVIMVHTFPTLDQWLEDGAVWEGSELGTILPTCMKAIPRARPPPRPAGLHRVDEDTRLRWVADDHRFPPYQYDWRFIVWVGQRWRLITADEREILHGLGAGHTLLGWNANKIKANPKGFEDMRKLQPVLTHVCTESALDEAVADWVESQFHKGFPLHLVGDALSGLHHFEPWTRRKLPKSWKLYSVWRRFEVPCRAPPITQDITLAMAGWCLLQGELTMSALLLLGFHALLRTGELLSVRPVDFLLQRDKGLVTLASSKSGVRNNSKESVSLHDPIVLDSLQAMVALKTQLHREHLPCWDRSGTAFRRLFQRALEAVGAGSLNLRPYSLRRGGATYEMQAHGLMEKTLLRGRWKNSNIARIYICDGLALLTSLRLTWESKLLIAKFSAVYTAEQKSFVTSGSRGKKRKAGGDIGNFNEVCSSMSSEILPWIS
eukprot:Skav225198  [mRNA]  locus=scaffold3065:268759:273280:+ [translate_table: standard]